MNELHEFCLESHEDIINHPVQGFELGDEPSDGEAVEQYHKCFHSSKIIEITIPMPMVLMSIMVPYAAISSLRSSLCSFIC